MSKIICDICGTTYPDTAKCCPICGCTRDDAAALLGGELTDEITDEPKGRGGHFSPAKKRKEIFDFDEVNPPKTGAAGNQASAPKREEPMDDEEPYDEEPRHNTGVVILLTALIAVLLLSAGFLFVRYFLPGLKGGDSSAKSTQPETSEAAKTEEIPCQNLVLLSGEAKLYSVGGLHAINVFAQPENTTDKITFRSADESVATVDETGLVTAVGQGTTEIHITCGSQEEICPVTVTIEEETTAPTEGETTAATEGGNTDATEATEATTAPTTNPDVKLKLKKTDISLGVHYEFQLLLNCKLEQNAVQWSSEHPNIASVDAEGNVKALKKGTTSITAKYGDQEVSCIVRCN